METKINSGMSTNGEVDLAAKPEHLNLGLKSLYQVECLDPQGNVKWTEEVYNTVVNVGLDDILDKYFKGSTYTAAHYVGLKGTGSIAASDTMTSHAGWSEITPYSDANRPTLTMGTVSGQSVDNSASKASFTINASANVFGAFVNTDNVKASTAGTLYGAADFSVSRVVQSGDTLNVTITATAAAA